MKLGGILNPTPVDNRGGVFFGECWFFGGWVCGFWVASYVEVFLEKKGEALLDRGRVYYASGERRAES
jgi:hypothetical protein